MVNQYTGQQIATDSENEIRKTLVASDKNLA
jgi:hypothetical protein